MTDQPTDFRALCAELERECFSLYADICATQDFNDTYLERMDGLRDRARAALDTPPLAPIPVTERLPKAEDCAFNAGATVGRCWCYSPPDSAFGVGYWICDPLEYSDAASHWLPWWAIPLPENPNDPPH